MKHKIITILQDDIIIDHKSQEQLLFDACTKRTVPMVVSGMLQNDDKIYCMLTETTLTLALSYRYHLVPFSYEQHDEILAEIGSRFFYGFTIIGTFLLSTDTWALFRYNTNLSDELQLDNPY